MYLVFVPFPESLSCLLSNIGRNEVILTENFFSSIIDVVLMPTPQGQESFGFSFSPLLPFLSPLPAVFLPFPPYMQMVSGEWWVKKITTL